MKTNEPHTHTANVNRLEARDNSFELPSSVIWPRNLISPAASLEDAILGGSLAIPAFT